MLEVASQCKTNNGPITIATLQVNRNSFNVNMSTCLVTCSNGVGCPGTSGVLIISIYQFKAEQKVDIFQIVRSMQSHRPGLVGPAHDIH